jgi:hypothetical protein
MQLSLERVPIDFGAGRFLRLRSSLGAFDRKAASVATPSIISQNVPAAVPPPPFIGPPNKVTFGSKPNAAYLDRWEIVSWVISRAPPEGLLRLGRLHFN